MTYSYKVTNECIQVELLWIDLLREIHLTNDGDKSTKVILLFSEIGLLGPWQYNSYVFGPWGPRGRIWQMTKALCKMPMQYANVVFQKLGFTEIGLLGPQQCISYVFGPWGPRGKTWQMTIAYCKIPMLFVIFQCHIPKLIYHMQSCLLNFGPNGPP